MKRFTALLIVFFMLFLSGCSEKTVSDPAAESVTVDVPEGNDVEGFTAGNEASYLLKIYDDNYDVTGYVVSCEGHKAFVDTDLLTEFGYAEKERKEKAENVKEYQGMSGDIIQFDIGTAMIFRNGNPMSVKDKIYQTEDGKVAAPITFLLILGGSGLHVDREGETMIFTVE